MQYNKNALVDPARTTFFYHTIRAFYERDRLTCRRSCTAQQSPHAIQLIAINGFLLFFLLFSWVCEHEIQTKTQSKGFCIETRHAVNPREEVCLPGVEACLLPGQLVLPWQPLYWQRGQHSQELGNGQCHFLHCKITSYHE